MSDTLLKARGLERRFGSRTAVAGVDLDLCRGEVLGLLGLNGAGKTTTLQMLCGVLAPTTGGVHVAGHDLLEAARSAKACLGYLPELPPLQADSRVRDYLAWTARLRRVPRAQIAGAVDRVLARCALESVAHRVIRNLSKGYQQRVGIAQAIVHEPALIVLDEPTVGLDPRQVQGIRELIADLRHQHGIIFSSHILAEVQAVSDRVTILHHGRAIYSGAATEAAGSQPRYLARFEATPDRQLLAAVDGVLSVAAAPGGGVLLALTGEAVLDRVVAESVRQGWGLRELGRERRTLEQVFLDLTEAAEETAA